MAADGASGMAVGLGIKHGVFVAIAAALVSLLATAVGFTVVPLAKGKETLDAARRLAAGLLCSFTIGPLLASWVITEHPSYIEHWLQVIGPGPDTIVWAYLAAATPFIAMSGIVGFWVVAAVMRFFTKRQKADALDMVNEVLGRKP